MTPKTKTAVSAWTQALEAGRRGWTSPESLQRDKPYRHFDF